MALRLNCKRCDNNHHKTKEVATIELMFQDKTSVDVSLKQHLHGG